MTQQLFAGFAATAFLALSGAALADPPAPAPSSPPPPAATPPDTAGAIAMLKLWGPTANPVIKGSFAALNIATTGARTEVVYLSGSIYAPNKSAPVREIMAYAAKVTGPIDPALALRLLKSSDQMLPIGAWTVVTTTDGSQMIEFEGYIAVDASAETVQQAITYAANTADKLEAELTNKDDY